MYPPLDTVISNILDQHVGEQNAISVESLIDQVNRHIYNNYDGHVYFQKEIRDAIHDLRKSGSLICASSNGYYRPATLNELDEFVERVYRNQARDELDTARRLRKAGREYFGGQLSLSM